MPLDIYRDVILPFNNPNLFLLHQGLSPENFGIGLDDAISHAWFSLDIGIASRYSEIKDVSALAWLKNEAPRILLPEEPQAQVYLKNNLIRYGNYELIHIARLITETGESYPFVIATPFNDSRKKVFVESQLALQLANNNLGHLANLPIAKSLYFNPDHFMSLLEPVRGYDEANFSALLLKSGKIIPQIFQYVYFERDDDIESQRIPVIGTSHEYNQAFLTSLFISEVVKTRAIMTLATLQSEGNEVYGLSPRLSKVAAGDFMIGMQKQSLSLKAITYRGGVELIKDMKQLIEELLAETDFIYSLEGATVNNRLPFNLIPTGLPHREQWVREAVAWTAQRLNARLIPSAYKELLTQFIGTDDARIKNPDSNKRIAHMADHLYKYGADLI